MYFTTDDTIVALSSAGGVSLRGLIRISGPKAYELAGDIFIGESAENHTGQSQAVKERPYSGVGFLKEHGGWIRHYGAVRLDDQIACPAELYVFRRPISYTGQDMAELHLPGSPALLQMVLSGLMNAGARMAQPGEFTARAFLNDRMNLSQAEAVAEIVSARSDAQLRGAQRLLDGALRRRCEPISSLISDVLALVETGIDFSDQDIPLTPVESLRTSVGTAKEQLERLLAESISWEDLNYLPEVVVAGPSNAGKSSLTNALLGIDRSIVNATAGTTRDVLTAPLQLNQGECLLLDTAGFGPVADPLADQAQDLTRRSVNRCDLVLWVIDMEDGRTIRQIAHDVMLGLEMDIPDKIVFVANKIDLCRDLNRRIRQVEQVMPSPFIPVSALRGDNLDQIKNRIEQGILGGPTDITGQTLALTVRQRQELVESLKGLSQAYDLLSSDAGYEGEFVSLELRWALEHLGGISGERVDEEILGRIFSRFCVGK